MTTTPLGRTDDLEPLAWTHFGDLYEAELKVLRAAPNGAVARCGPNPDHPDSEVRAELIRWLCIDRQAAEKVDPRGIRVMAARVTGGLDLESASVSFPLQFLGCRLVEDINLADAHVPGLTLNGSRVCGLSAERLYITGSVFLSQGFTAKGEVRLLGAQVGGHLDCSEGTFINPGGTALMADGVRVMGDILLCQGFTARGEVRLPGAQIGGHLDCSGGTFINPPVKGQGGSGIALLADDVKVRGSVFLRTKFNSEGVVRLSSAQIGGQLDCSGGTFRNPATQDQPGSSIALHADGVKVRGGVLFREGFTAEGGVRLPGAQISSSLDCSGGTFTNPSGEALRADGVLVAGAVFLSKGFTGEGRVRLPGAQINGFLDCSAGTFTELVAESATIKGTFFWKEIQGPEDTKLDLINASVGAIADEERSWPGKGNLWLDRLTYNRFSMGPWDATSRLKWLSRQTPFTPQPYRQLASVLHETGHERGAHEALFEMERRRRRQGNPGWLQRWWSWLLRSTIGYGHKTWRALIWLLALTFLGFVFSTLGYLGGAIAPIQKEAFEVFNQRGAPPPYYQRFNAAVYSLEHSFPFVELGQRDHWAPAFRGSEHAEVLTSPGLLWMRDLQVRGVHIFRLNAPGFLRLWLWFQIAAGWILATLFVAGLTGIVRSR